MIERNEGFFSYANLQRGIFLALIVAVGYFLPNNYVIFPLHQVALTRVDHWIDLQPAWIWFYVSYYALLIWAYLYTTGTRAQQVYFGAIATAAITGFVIYVFFPTTISRELYPWTGEMSVSARLLAHIRGADFPVNCFPSMHVCMSLIAACCISLVAGRTGRVLVWLWYFGIVYSTMATKQHYFVDVLSGFGLGSLCLAIFLYRYGVLPDLVEWIASNDHSGHMRLAPVNARRSAPVGSSRARLRSALSKLRKRA